MVVVVVVVVVVCVYRLFVLDDTAVIIRTIILNYNTV